MLGEPAIAGRFVPCTVLVVDVLLLLKLLLPDSDADRDLREGRVTIPATTNLSAVVRLFGKTAALPC